MDILIFSAVLLILLFFIFRHFGFNALLTNKVSVLELVNKNDQKAFLLKNISRLKHIPVITLLVLYIAMLMFFLGKTFNRETTRFNSQTSTIEIKKSSYWGLKEEQSVYIIQPSSK